MPPRPPRVLGVLKTTIYRFVDAGELSYIDLGLPANRVWPQVRLVEQFDHIGAELAPLGSAGVQPD